MKYSIQVNDIVVAQAGTRDVAVFVAKKLKEAKPEDKVVAYKYGEVLYQA